MKSWLLAGRESYRSVWCTACETTPSLRRETHGRVQGCSEADEEGPGASSKGNSTNRRRVVCFGVRSKVAASHDVGCGPQENQSRAESTLGEGAEQVKSWAGKLPSCSCRKEPYNSGIGGDSTL